MYKPIIKPLFDFLAAFIGLLVLSPVFILTMIGLAIANNGKPFFFQKRPGKNEKIFRIIKFKTMNDAKNKSGKLLPDEKRLTAAGKFVRKNSLDEIPQLINVLKGDMSLIGPRPLLVKYLPYYSEREKLRHSVKPGITGWAQVNGRNTVGWDKRLAMDVDYVNNISLKLDVKIFSKTIKNILRRKDIVIIPGGNLMTLDKYRS